MSSPFLRRGKIYAGCQKFVNSFPALHRHLKCHSRCHFLLGEVVISNFNFAMWSKPCVCVCHMQACVDIHLCVCVCVSKLKLQGCVLKHRHLMCRTAPEVKQDVCHLFPDSAVDTVNLVMSPLTTIIRCTGLQEGNLQTHLPLQFKL